MIGIARKLSWGQFTCHCYLVMDRLALMGQAQPNHMISRALNHRRACLALSCLDDYVVV